MKKLFLLCTLLGSVNAFAATTELNCYRAHVAQLVEADVQVVKGYDNLYVEEDSLLDQYLSPGQYTKGPQVPFKENRMKNLINKRAQSQQLINLLKTKADLINTSLNECLKNSTK